MAALRMRTLTAAALREMPLPSPGGDKEQRGRVLVVGGAMRVPGAALLAGEAASRAGAGKLQIATLRVWRRRWPWRCRRRWCWAWGRTDRAKSRAGTVPWMQHLQHAMPP